MAVLNKRGAPYSYAISNHVQNTLADLAEKAQNKEHPDPEARRALSLAIGTIDDLVHRRRNPTKELEFHVQGSDLRDCDTTYAGASPQEKQLGLPAYRLITRELPPLTPGGKPVLEFIAFGERESEKVYKDAASVLGRKQGELLPDDDLGRPLQSTLRGLQPQARRSQPAHGAPRPQPRRRPTYRPSIDIEYPQDGSESQYGS